MNIKCPKCLEDKSKLYAFKDNKWCDSCILDYAKEEYHRARTKWMQQDSVHEIDRLLKRYCTHNHMMLSDGGWLIGEPGYDSSNTTTYLSPYKLYDYSRLIEQWNMTGQYTCDKNMISIMSPCNNCGSKCSPETRTFIEHSPLLRFKCTHCDQECDNPDGIFQCECYDVCGEMDSLKYKLKQTLTNSEDHADIDKIDTLSNKFISNHINGCMYACDVWDRRDLLVLPGYERVIFGRGLTRADIETQNPDLLKYYDQEDYFLSYVYICLNCKKNQTFRADHVAFDIGDVFDCPHCHHPFTYFKVSKKGPFKVPSQYQFIFENME